MGDDKEEQQAVKNNPLLDSIDGATEPASAQVMDKPKTGHGKKVMVFLLVIILIAGAAGGVYYWQQQQAKKQQAELQSQIDALKSQVADAEKKVKEVKKTSTDETTDWKSYENKEGAFSIKYPNDYVVFTASTCPGIGDDVKAKRGISVAKTKERLPICNADKFSQMSFTSFSQKDAINWNKTVADKTYTKEVTKSSINLNGVPGTKFTYTNTGEGMQTKGSKYVVFMFIKGDNQYNAVYFQEDIHYPDDLSTFDKIVKTWKF